MNTYAIRCDSHVWPIRHDSDSNDSGYYDSDSDSIRGHLDIYIYIYIYIYILYTRMLVVCLCVCVYAGVLSCGHMPMDCSGLAWAAADDNRVFSAALISQVRAFSGAPHFGSLYGKNT